MKTNPPFPLLPLFTLFPLLLATPAPAQILSIGTEAQVPASAAGFQAAPATAVAPSGGSLVVWQSAGSGGQQDTDVFARAFGPDGAPLGPEFLVNTYLPGCQQNPDVAAAPDGSFTVVWQSEEQDGNGSGVFFRRFSAGGTALTAETQVNSTTAGDQRAPRVAHDAAGSFVFAWESFGQDGDGWGVVARRFGVSGPLSSEVTVPTVTAGDQRHPDLAFQPTGPVVFAWESTDDEGSGIFLRRFEVDLTTIGPSLSVQAHAAAGFQSFPSLGTDASGNVIVLWEAASVGAVDPVIGPVIQARRFDRFLAPVDTVTQADAGSLGPSSRPAVESAGSGDFLALWEGWSADQGGPGVVVQTFDFREAPAAGSGLVHASFLGEQGRPALAVSSSGNFLAAWQSLGQDGDGSGVFSRRFAFLGHDFHSIAPCRIVDTRPGSALTSAADRLFNLSSRLAACNIPETARALALNVAVTGAEGNGYVTLFPGDAPLPLASSINFRAGRLLSNNALLPLARNGTSNISARAVVEGGGQVHLILDAGGYFE
jgi:hypothetical protein